MSIHRRRRNRFPSSSGRRGNTNQRSIKLPPSSLPSFPARPSHLLIGNLFSRSPEEEVDGRALLVLMAKCPPPSPSIVVLPQLLHCSMPRSSFYSFSSSSILGKLPSLLFPLSSPRDYDDDDGRGKEKALLTALLRLSSSQSCESGIDRRPQNGADFCGSFQVF